jgi:hypothetical protein
MKINLLLVSAIACLLLAACGKESSLGDVIEPTEKEAPGAAISPSGERSNEDSPLPHGNALRDSIAELRERAQRGDARAACQLATELDFCASAEARARALSQASARLQGISTDNSSKQNGLDAFAQAAKAQTQHCAGISNIDSKDRIQNWRLAASRGHAPSMLHYASGLVFTPNETLLVLDELNSYKALAPIIMKKVAAAGSLDANLMLARAYAPHQVGPDRVPYFRQSIQARDASTSLAYFQIAEHLSTAAGESASDTREVLLQEMERLKQGMSPEQVAAANQEYNGLKQGMRQSIDLQLPATGWDEREQFQPKPSIERCDQKVFIR